MLYAATAFWLMIVVLCAWGVHTLWCGFGKARAVNIALLPGTLIAQMGHVLGLLLTGASVRDLSLFGRNTDAEPQQDDGAKPRIPILGPAIVGMMPLVFCGLAMQLGAKLLGGGTARNLLGARVGQTLPYSLGGFWDLLHDQLTLMETTLSAVLRTGATDWRSWLFVYLLVCLTVRMAPLSGNVRGSLGAAALFGLLTAGIGLFLSPMAAYVRGAWPLLSLSVAMLSLLLVLTVLVRGIVGLVRVVRQRG